LSGLRGHRGKVASARSASRILSFDKVTVEENLLITRKNARSWRDAKISRQTGQSPTSFALMIGKLPVTIKLEATCRCQH
jgi:hypothetical protein